MLSVTIKKWATEKRLRSLAGSRVFLRGLDYFKKGHVTRLAWKKNRVTAIVRGSRRYACGINKLRQNVVYSCECPAFEDADFCKHLVAVGLAVMHGEASGGESLAWSLECIQDIKKATKEIKKFSKEQLIEILLKNALRDASLARMLRFEVLIDRCRGLIKRKRSKDLLNLMKVVFDDITNVEPRYHEWLNENLVTDPIQEFVSLLQNLLQNEEFAVVYELSEYFRLGLEPIIEYFEEGNLLYDLLEELKVLHLKAFQNQNVSRKN